MRPLVNSRRWLRVREALVKKQWSFGDLARVAEMARGSVYNVINGQNRSPSTRQKIERLLETKVWPDSSRRITPPAMAPEQTKPKPK